MLTGSFHRKALSVLYADGNAFITDGAGVRSATIEPTELLTGTDAGETKIVLGSALGAGAAIRAEALATTSLRGEGVKRCARLLLAPFTLIAERANYVVNDCVAAWLEILGESNARSIGALAIGRHLNKAVIGRRASISLPPLERH